MQVAIIGAGPLGRWLALVVARAGYTVLLEDVMPSNLHHAQEYLRQQLGPAALPKVTFATTIEEAVREADLAIDCVPDELESKLEIFCLLDRMAPPRTVLITPTKRQSIADLASCTYRPDKCVALVADVQELTGMAMTNGEERGNGAAILLRTPPQVSVETIAVVREFWERIGFAPRYEADLMP
ncbi:MAG: 3-hydroxyacyl-CoA dehydrogenase NAD-binding domain-containing protein [Terracidiphilus sp.]